MKYKNIQYKQIETKYWTPSKLKEILKNGQNETLSIIRTSEKQLP